MPDHHHLLLKLALIQTPAFLYVPSFHHTQHTDFFETTTHSNIAIYYSVKTNDSYAVLKKLAEHAAGMEIISLRELELVNTIPGVKKVIVNGPAKTEALLKAAVERDAYIYIDNEHEFYLLEKLLKARKKSIEVGLRLTYGDHAHDQKFGIHTQSSFYQNLLTDKNIQNAGLKITGLHAHVSSYQESETAFYHRISDMKKKVDELEQRGFDIKNVNIGGGFEPTIRLNNQLCWEKNRDVEKKMSYIQQIYLSDPKFLEKKSLFMEPGRALCEGAILGIGEVLNIKITPNVTFIFLDFSTAFAGGTHPAESCIQMFVLEKKTHRLYPLKKDPTSKMMLCGPLCSSNDNFGFYSGKNFSIGDKVILLNAGAYSLSFRWHGPESLPQVSYFDME
jgi:diaminopimelate decarboxylase